MSVAPPLVAWLNDRITPDVPAGRPDTVNVVQVPVVRPDRLTAVGVELSVGTYCLTGGIPGQRSPTLCNSCVGGTPAPALPAPCLQDPCRSAAACPGSC